MEKVTIDMSTLVALLTAASPAKDANATPVESTVQDQLIGRYVIVRCHDAGVHAGFLESRSGRECVLTQSRRLWYWKCKKSAFLSGVAVYGLHSDSNVGAEIERICLTENCEIILCTKAAQKSISEMPEHE